MKLKEAYETEFEPGDEVPFSGIYIVTHDTTHQKEHEVTCIQRRIFPPCRNCKHPLFKLKYNAHHIETHKRFVKG